ncbi:thioredoxin family protein [Bacillus aquiflavi]|uniref:Thioredoxin family protein n=1 Tax=Bacillus aquiflavi TaxID=2672567 RepID=A0A6B3W233_9BACI|nr:thioredoxin family protein [Bacillus aquiflavi]MBA4537709.1 thioredoxin family protein [Bacillus aquiflavi]NEY81966.1 thioredoxin family protein [Bacillus aquiflavi]UAC47588.1 thioredoxin family protein [Bacillus aquiflavi]
MKQLSSVEEFEKLQNNGKIMFLFSTDWCPDCRVIEPFLPEIEAKYSEFTFVYVDRDKFIDLCSQFDIFGIPSFLAFENGKELGRFVSKNRKTRDEIEQFIESIR